MFLPVVLAQKTRAISVFFLRPNSRAWVHSVPTGLWPFGCMIWLSGVTCGFLALAAVDAA